MQTSSEGPGHPDHGPGWAQVVGGPIRTLSPAARTALAVVCMVVCMGLAYIIIEPGFVFTVPDSDYYKLIAQLDTAHVMQPFASRQLSGLLVHGLMTAFHLSIRPAFLVETAISFTVTLTVLYGLLVQTAAPRWMMLAIALVPYWFGQMQYLVLPDVCYSALVALLLYLLWRRQMLGAALMMFPLMVCRESTSLTLVCLLVAAWGWLRWRDRVIAVAAAVAGSAVVAHLSRASQTNVEHLPQSIYMLAKVPWNFLRNILGVLPWSNVNAELCTVPRWAMPLHFGAVRDVGFCGYSVIGQFSFVSAVLTQFGLLPLLMAILWWRHRRFAGRSPVLRFVLLYGGASMVLAPLLGNWMAHLIGYAWPLFLVALPMLFNEFDLTRQTARQMAAGAGFFALHLAVFAASGIQNWGLLVAVEAALWVCGYVVLRFGWLPAEQTRTA